MSGRYVNHNGIADAKRKEAYIAHRNMLIGMALREKLNEDKEDRKKHLRNDLINVRKEENIND